MVLEKVKLYLDGTMLRFESEDEDFRTRSVPTGRIEAAFQGDGFTFTDVVQETLVCSVDSFDDVLDAAGATYGASQEDVAVALNVFLNFKAGSGGSTDYVENVALNGDSLDFTAIGSAFGGSVNLSGLGDNIYNSNGVISTDFTPTRTVDANDNELEFTNLERFEVLGNFSDGRNNVTLVEGFKTITLRAFENIRLVSSQNFRIEIPSVNALGQVLAVTNVASKEFEAVDISTLVEVFAPNVADESARDIAYPSPSDGQRVFNSRTQEIETYVSAFGLWLSPTKKVAIRQTPLLVDRFVYINSFFTVSGVAYPALTYPTDAANENQTYGVIVEIGDSIDVARDFVAVAVGNQQFVDFGEAIAVGEYVSAKIAGVNQDLGFAAGNATTSGRAGIALQNSGATIGKPTKVLVQLNLLAESF